LSNIKGKREIGDLPSHAELYNRRPFEKFDPVAITVLNHIVNITKAEIVITSDWMKHCTFEYIENFYIEQGLKKPLTFINSTNKKASISDFLSKNTVSAWVCIDDIFISVDNFVWT